MLRRGTLASKCPGPPGSCIEPPGNGQQAVADRLGVETAAVHAAQQAILGSAANIAGDAWLLC